MEHVPQLLLVFASGYEGLGRFDSDGQHSTDLKTKLTPGFHVQRSQHPVFTPVVPGCLPILLPCFLKGSSVADQFPGY